MSFVHLHVHSCYTFLRGLYSPHEICQEAKNLGFSAIALTDTNGMYGLPDFLAAAEKHGIKPLVGAQIKAPDAHAILLAKDPSGYRFICSLLTRLHRDKQCFSLLRELARGTPGCVVLSSALPLLTVLRGKADVFAELLPGGAGFSTFKVARDLDIPVVTTGGVYFMRPENFNLHRTLRAIDLNTTVDMVPEEELAPKNAFLADPKTMAALVPYAPDGLHNTVVIAEGLPREWKRGGEVFPQWNGREESFEALRRRCVDGAKKRYGRVGGEVITRLDAELALIREKRFCDYFLLVADIVAAFPITCGRGSAAASLVSYCLGITHVDPIKSNLLFSRFLNEGRIDLPDIDVDFPWDERDAVIKYVQETFGEEKVAAVANVIGFRSRAAVREVAKVFGIPDHEIKEVTKRFSSDTSVAAILQRVNEHPLFKGRPLPQPWPDILAEASRLEQSPRHLGTHCGGIVVTPTRVADYVPVEVSAKGVPLIQWNKDGAEERGLVKMDILGNRSLAVIRDALRAVEKNQGVVLSYAGLNPIEDEATQRLIRSGRTMGVFYIESPAMRRLLVMAGKSDYPHLVALSSIIRPAANKVIIEYVRRLRGGGWKELHPLVEDILAENLGIMIYQEDVARIAGGIAGFTEAEADYFRKILSKKTRDGLATQKEKFYCGALRKEVPTKVIDALWEMIASFEGYSFCKAHSASYALVSFKAAYLKAHFPTEFMAAVLTNGGGFYSPRAYLSEIERMGFAVLPPDVNESEKGYTGTGRGVRVGLAHIRGVSRRCLETIIEGRNKRRFESFFDFSTRVKLGKPDCLLLLKAGALDSIGKELGRIGMAWCIKAQGTGDELAVTSGLPTGDIPVAIKCSQEMEALGFPVFSHPLDFFRERVSGLRTQPIPAKALSRHLGKRVTMVGIPIAQKNVHTKTGEPMEFVSLEDLTDVFEATLFPSVYRQFCRNVSLYRPVVIRGVVESMFSAFSIRVETMEPL
ncbi:MAG: DNA polymerase III subunit alpha [Deltaproteobacteria bacterium]|nr:DNA polymerase III subunit alpha [Deltaproteobacteria bacterium]